MKKFIFVKPPEQFSPAIEVASCYFTAENKFLLLQYASSKRYANTWCVPAGKMEKGELAEHAVLREVFEETGIVLKKEDVSFVQKVYVRYPEIDFVFHIFRSSMQRRPKIKIDKNEHQDVMWVTKQEALAMNLVPGEKEVISMFL